MTKLVNAGMSILEGAPLSDLLDRLSLGRPHLSGQREGGFLQSWADSHGLVANAFEGRSSPSDYIFKGLCLTFEQGAQIHLDFQRWHTSNREVQRNRFDARAVP